MKEFDMSIIEATIHMDHNKKGICECEEFEDELIYCISNGELICSTEIDDLDTNSWQSIDLEVNEITSKWRILR